MVHFFFLTFTLDRAVGDDFLPFTRVEWVAVLKFRTSRVGCGICRQHWDVPCSAPERRVARTPRVGLGLFKTPFPGQPSSC
ncbi:hypothetical protein TNCV_2037781 [Trichonephila clavipes]|nr:hypothetical protein TNCV_2037781 [Trichonephila clavipes]